MLYDEICLIFVLLSLLVLFSMMYFYFKGE